MQAIKQMVSVLTILKIEKPISKFASQKSTRKRPIINKKQCELIFMLASKFNYDQMASKCGISKKNVLSTLYLLRKKFNVKTNGDLPKAYFKLIRKFQLIDEDKNLYEYKGCYYARSKNNVFKAVPKKKVQHD